MSENGGSAKILSREELEDLLEARDGGAGGGLERLVGRLPRLASEGGDAAGDAERQLRRTVETAASRWGRRMASSYQRRIECSLIGWESFDAADVACAILDSDAVACFTLTPQPGAGFVLIGRPLFLALLSLEFGGGQAKPAPGTPRPYSGIERRLLGRIVRDLLASLESEWQTWSAVRTELTGLTSREGMLERVSPRLLMASLDVSALDAVGRVRVGIPPEAFGHAAAAAPASTGDADDRLERSVFQLPLTLRAELGSTELSLAELSRLQVGDVLPIRPSASDGVLIRVEGKAKFRAIPGSVGSRLAAQAVERL